MTNLDGRDKRRAFTRTQQNEILAQQGMRCAGDHCGHAPLDPRAKHFHHMKAWADKGKTTVSNGAALCPKCHTLVEHQARLKKIESNGAAKKDSAKQNTTKIGKVAPAKKRKRKAPFADELGPYGTFFDER